MWTRIGLVGCLVVTLASACAAAGGCEVASSPDAIGVDAHEVVALDAGGGEAVGAADAVVDSPSVDALLDALVDASAGDGGGEETLGDDAEGDDVADAAVEAPWTLCLPCEEDAACEGGGLCVSYGSAGSFCGAACAGEGDCPGGYACQALVAEMASQCVLAEGECACPEVPEAVGASTACGVESAFGVCAGVRFCGAGGLSGCNGPTATLEICNGADDDCDGATDEADGAKEPCSRSSAFGVCSGFVQCIDHTPHCDAPEPALEACNGVDDDCDGETDEGFPDTDGDGQDDCQDTDDDDDGYPDALDCCPLAKNADQSDLDGDGKGDVCDLDDDGDGVPDGLDLCRTGTRATATATGWGTPATRTTTTTG